MTGARTRRKAGHVPENGHNQRTTARHDGESCEKMTRVRMVFQYEFPDLQCRLFLLFMFLFIFIFCFSKKKDSTPHG